MPDFREVSPATLLPRRGIGKVELFLVQFYDFRIKNSMVISEKLHIFTQISDDLISAFTFAQLVGLFLRIDKNN